MTRRVEVRFDFRSGYPAGPNLVYECLRCGDFVPSKPASNIGCKCDNIFVDIDAGRFSVDHDDQIKLFRVEPS